MDPAAAPTDLWGVHGFVTTIRLNNTANGDIWNRSTGISFVLFMVIGFCATLGAIGMAVVVFLICRRCQRRRIEREARDIEATAVIPEPKEMYLVVHPGGSADVAHKDLDDSPRKMVLKNQPIQLSSAVLDMGSGSFADELGKEDCVPTKNEPSIRVLNLTANSRLSADGNLQASQRIQRIRLDSVDMTDSPKIMACHPQLEGLHRGGHRRSQSSSQEAGAGLSQAQTLSRQSTASETNQDDALLLTPRFKRSEM